MTDPDRLDAIKTILQEITAAESTIESEDLGVALGIEGVRWLVGEVIRLRGLLARLEWAGEAHPGERIGTYPRCPVCRVEGPPHDRGCWLAAALRPTTTSAPHP